MSRRHKVFVSFHHANDVAHKTIFELRFGNAFGVIVPGSPGLGDIDPDLPDETIRQKIRDEYLRDTSVTVVLIGKETWKRKHVDWEISSSIRQTKHSPRSGLLGLILPSHPDYGRDTFDPGRVPARLAANLECGYAAIYDWSNSAEKVQDRVHDAYLHKSRVDPDNSLPLFRRNRS